MDTKDIKIDNYPLDNMNWAKDDDFNKNVIYECVQDLIEDEL